MDTGRDDSGIVVQVRVLPFKAGMLYRGDSPTVTSDYCHNNFKVLKALGEDLIQSLERLTGILNTRFKRSRNADSKNVFK